MAAAAIRLGDLVIGSRAIAKGREIAKAPDAAAMVTAVRARVTGISVRSTEAQEVEEIIEEAGKGKAKVEPIEIKVITIEAEVDSS